MAVDSHLTRRRTRRRLLALLAVVLVGHGVALHWLSRWQAQAASLLRPLATPMYTRVLQPQAPVAPPRAEPAPPPAAAAPRNRIQAAPAKPSTPPRTTPATPPVAEPPAPEPASSPDQPTGESSEAQAPAEPPAPEQAATPSVPPGTDTAAAAPPPLDSWPADTRLRYRLGGRFRSGDLYGNARVLWQREQERYQVRVEVEVTFMANLVLTSQGEVSTDGLMPKVFEELSNGRTRGLRIGERDVTLNNGEVVARPPGLQDTASQFVELTHRFATGRAKLEVGEAVRFWMARPGAVDLWTYDVVEREVLRTPLGDIEAFHLKPRPLAIPRGNITAEMWYAPSLQYLPIRIRVNMGDEAQIDLTVEAIEQR